MAIEARRTRNGCVIEVRDDSSGLMTRHQFQRDDLRPFLVGLAKFLITASEARKSPLRRQRLLRIAFPDWEIGLDASGRIELAFAGEQFPSLHFLLDDRQAKPIMRALAELLQVPQASRAQRKKH
jgi:hypothetical protein